MEKLPLKSKSKLPDPIHMTPVLIFSLFSGLKSFLFPLGFEDCDTKTETEPN